MKTLKNIFTKIAFAFSYIYFSLAALLIFSDHLNTTGTVWSEFLMLSIASVFILQFKYQFKYGNAVLGTFTFLWSAWMFLAAYSDAMKLDHWTWTLNELFLIAFVSMNFICSISLLIKAMRPFRLA